MKILDPVLVPDVSIWCDHINPKEFEDGGCASVVIGIYPSFDSTGKKILSPISRQQCTDVATKSSLVLQVYFWDDITQDPIQQNGGAVPKQWIPAVEQGVRDGLTKGPLGHTVVDLHVTLLDGAWHSVTVSVTAAWASRPTTT